MKRTISFILCAVMLATLLLCGCDKNKTANGDRTTLRIEIFDSGDTPANAGSMTDNAITRWAQKEFGDPNNIDLEFVAVPRMQETTQLNVMMAAKDAPDIITTYDYTMLYNYAKDGGLMDLTDVVEKEGSNLVEFLGQDLLDEAKIDGKQYFIPSKRLVRGMMAQVVRQDWLDKLGMEAPTNTDEFYEMLKAFKEKDPGNVGDKLVPWAMSGASYYHFRDLVCSFIDTEGMSEIEILATDDFLKPGFKEGIRFLNKLYNEGLISADYMLDKDRKQAEANMANGYSGFLNDDLGRPLNKGGVYETLQKTVPGAKLTAVDTFRNKEGKYPKNLYSANGIYMAVPSFSKNAEAAIKYLNWMAQEDVLFTIQNGFEGVTYNLDENGFPVVIDSEESRKTHWYNLGFYMGLVVNGTYVKNDELSIKFNAQSTVDPELFLACHENSVRDGSSQMALPPTEADTKYGASYGEKIGELFSRPVMAPPEKFDEIYDEIEKAAREQGGDAIIAAKIKQLEEIMK